MTDFGQILFREIKDGSEKNNSSEKSIIKEIIKKKVIKKSKRNIKKNTSAVFPVDKKRTEEKQLKKKESYSILSREAIKPLWLSLFEAAKLGGIDKKTLKRAIKKNFLKYRIIDNRYQVELRSVVLFMYGRKKLWNKLRENGIGQYIEKWVS
jgi:hypothetical protein